MYSSSIQFNNRWFPVLLWVLTTGLILADLGFLWVQFHFSLSLPWHAHLLFYAALLMKFFILKSLILKKGMLKQQVFALSGLLISNSIIGMITLLNQPIDTPFLLLEKWLIIAVALLLAIPLKPSMDSR